MKNPIIRFDLKKALRRIKGPKTAKRILQVIPQIPGESFLLNYKELEKAVYKYDEVDIINYIVLAAKRDYNYAKAYSDYSLDADFCPLTRAEIDANKLIFYKDGRIYFLFEEDSMAKYHRY